MTLIIQSKFALLKFQKSFNVKQRGHAPSSAIKVFERIADGPPCAIAERPVTGLSRKIADVGGAEGAVDHGGGLEKRDEESALNQRALCYLKLVTF
jgi:hypothetical protein